MYALGYTQISQTLGRMFGRRIVSTVLAVLGSGAAFIIYLLPEFAEITDWGHLVSAAFVLPLVAIAVVLLVELVVLGVSSAMKEHRLHQQEFSGYQLTKAEKAVRHLHAWCWRAPFVCGIITGLLVIGVALIF